MKKYVTYANPILSFGYQLIYFPSLLLILSCHNEKENKQLLAKKDRTVK
jgi:hypothetical protein